MKPLVVIVEDDESVRESLPDLLQELGYTALAFVSAEDFLDSAAGADAKCLILDIGLPGMSGVDLRREIVRRGLSIPIIFITGQEDRISPVGQLEDGVFACLLKPFSEQELRNALLRALLKR